MEIVEDAVFHILLWLPVTALLRFKAVCRSWRSLIESPTFISQHLQHNHHHHHLDDDDDDDEDQVIVFNPSGPGFSLLSGNNFQFIQKLEFRIDLGSPHPVYNKMIATCDGIVCLQHGEYPDISLWNPATRQFKTLPKAPQPLPYMASHRQFCYGFGFDHKTNDYKVVKIFIEVRNAPVYLDGPLPYSKPNTITNVYSLSTNSWRTVDAVLPVDFITSNPKVPLRNGIYCWVGAGHVNGEERFINQIFYFDFTTEEFGTIPVPDVYHNTLSGLFLGYLRDNITCTGCYGDWNSTEEWGFQIWVLNQGGGIYSWTKLYTLPIDRSGFFSGMSKNGKVFWYNLYNGTSGFVSDPVTLEKTILPIEKPSQRFQVALYKESLVSIKATIGPSATNNAICKDLSNCQLSA